MRADEWWSHVYTMQPKNVVGFRKEDEKVVAKRTYVEYAFVLEPSRLETLLS